MSPQEKILSARREHVDLERRVIYIPKAKAGAREQPISAQLGTFLGKYMAALATQAWLFPSVKSGSGHTTNIRKAFRRVVSAAAMNPDEVVRHTMRHTAITHLVQAGVDLPTVKRISATKRSSWLRTLCASERRPHSGGNGQVESRLNLDIGTQRAA